MDALLAAPVVGQLAEGLEQMPFGDLVLLEIASVDDTEEEADVPGLVTDDLAVS